MDHPHYDYSALPMRSSWRWPNGAGVALGVVLVVETVDATPETRPPLELAAGVGPRPHPNYPMLAHREYGQRVGIFRLFDALERHGIRPSVAIDAMSAEGYPALVEHARSRGAEFLGRGIAANRQITGAMTEKAESAYITETVGRLKAVLGEAPRGWLAPSSAESSRTPALLAAAGLQYLCDWANDEQPYAFTVPEGDLTSLPAAVDYDDGYALTSRRMTIDSFADLLVRGCATLLRESAHAPRSLVIVLRPWLTGQPFRIAAIDRSLGSMAGLDGVWAASTGEIVQAWRGATA